MGSVLASVNTISVAVKISNLNWGQIISGNSIVIDFAVSLLESRGWPLVEQSVGDSNPSLGIFAGTEHVTREGLGEVVDAAHQLSAGAYQVTGHVVEGLFIGPARSEVLSDLSTKVVSHASLVVSGNVEGVGSLPADKRALLARNSTVSEVGRHNTGAIPREVVRLGGAGVKVIGVHGHVKVVDKCFVVVLSVLIVNRVVATVVAVDDVDGRAEAVSDVSIQFSSIGVPEAGNNIMHAGLWRLWCHVEPESRSDS